MDVLNAMTPAQAAALWSGLLIVLMVVLAIRVISARRSNRVLIGDGGNAHVALSGRVFGNASEYIPLGVAALVVLVVLGTPLGRSTPSAGRCFSGGWCIAQACRTRSRPVVGFSAWC
jgi:hypothetical protein